MKQIILIFYPDETAYIGLWRSEHSPEWETEPVDMRHTEGNMLLTALDTLLTRHHCSVHAVTHIGVMNGPASYTQLRSFIATANSIAWALHLPLFSFRKEDDLPEAIPYLLPPAHVNKPVEPIYSHTIG